MDKKSLRDCADLVLQSRRDFPHIAVDFSQRFLELALSIITANKITPPLTTCCQNGETLSRTSPLFSTPMMMAPCTVPNTLPRPPDSEVPPITTAAMESSS